MGSSKSRRHRRTVLRAATVGLSAVRYETLDGKFIGYQDPFPPNVCKPLHVHCDPSATPIEFLRDYRLTGKHKGHDTTKIAEWYQSRGFRVTVKRHKRSGNAPVIVQAPPNPEENPRRYECTVTLDDGRIHTFNVTCKGSHNAAGAARLIGKIECIKNLD